MKLFLCFSFLFFITNGLWAQDSTNHRLYNEAMAFIAKKDYAEALKSINSILATDPENNQVIEQRVTVYGNLKRYPEAVSDCKHLIRLAPSRSIYYTSAGWYLLLNKEYEEAEKYSLQALSLDNTAYYNYLNLGHIKAFQGKRAEYAEYYLKALEYLPNKTVFEDGVLADLDLFEKEGLLPNLVPQLRTWFKKNLEFFDLTPATNIILDSIYNLISFKSYSATDPVIIDLKERFIREEQQYKKWRYRVMRDFFWDLGWYHYRINSRNQAVTEYFTNAVKISAGNLKDTAAVIEELYQVGAETRDIGLLKTALHFTNHYKSPEKQALIKMVIGDCFRDEGKRDSASHYYRQSLSGYRQAGISSGQGFVLNRLMAFYGDQKQLDSVSFYYNMIRSRRGVNKMEDEENIIDDINYVSYLLAGNKYGEALRYAKEFIEQYKNSGNVRVSKLHEQAGVALYFQKKPEDATNYFRTAIRLYNEFLKQNPDYKNSGGGRDLLPAYARQESIYYLKKIVRRKGNIPELFDLVEQAKANVLYPALTGVWYAPKSRTIDDLAKDLKPDELALSFSSSMDDGFAIAVSEHEQSVFIEDTVMIDQLFKKYYALMPTDESLELIRKQSIENKLNYSGLTDAQWKRVILLLSTAATNLMGMMEGETMKRGIIIKKKSSDSASVQKMRAANDILYHLYVKPFRKILAGKKTIYLSPDGGTTIIPFEAIMNEEGKYMGELYNIIYVPSFTAIEIIQANTKTDRREMLAIGNPLYTNFDPGETKGRAFDLAQMGFNNWTDLPGTGKELLSIKNTVPGVQLLDKANLTESNYKKWHSAGEINEYDILHFAVHGMMSMTDHQDNALILSEPGGNKEDGFLQFNEIADMRIKTRLVCLSACETAMGDPATNDIMNLPLAFFMAGAGSVIATWWKIDDEATAIFMSSFYNSVFVDKKSFSEAIFLTRVKFIRGDFGEKFKSPFYWAAFKYYGY